MYFILMPSSTKEMESNGDITQQREFRYFPTTRFVVQDTDGRTLAIAHVSEFLKDNSSEFEPVLFRWSHLGLQK